MGIQSMSIEKKHQCLKLIVSGRVQGVGYRNFTQKTARRLGITGTVCNLTDGCVEVIAQGTSDDLKLFLSSLKKGPILSNVTNIKVVPIEESKSAYHGFQVTF